MILRFELIGAFLLDEQRSDEPLRYYGQLIDFKKPTKIEEAPFDPCKYVDYFASFRQSPKSNSESPRYQFDNQDFDDVDEEGDDDDDDDDDDDEEDDDEPEDVEEEEDEDQEDQEDEEVEDEEDYEEENEDYENSDAEEEIERKIEKALFLSRDNSSESYSDLKAKHDSGSQHASKEASMESELNNGHNDIMNAFKDIEDELNKMRSLQMNKSEMYRAEEEQMAQAENCVVIRERQPLQCFYELNNNVTVEEAPKLKKFSSMYQSKSVNEEEKKKQEMILRQNEIEKEKNQMLVRQLVLDANKAESQSDSLSLNPVGFRIKRLFECQVCIKQAGITERVKIGGIVFHRDCVKCATCGLAVKNAESFIQNSDDQPSNFEFHLILI